jgi:hypothetical protein
MLLMKLLLFVLSGEGIASDGGNWKLQKLFFIHNYLLVLDTKLLLFILETKISIPLQN